MSPAPHEVLARLAGEDRFLVQQVFRPIANEYRISVPAAGSTEEGEPLLVVRQKRLKVREDIRFRLPGAEDGPHLFMIKSRTVFEFRGRHEVLDADGTKIGELQKAFGRSLLRSHWVVRDAGEQVVLEGRESSLAIALLRRLAGFLPDYLSLLGFVPFNFTLFREESEDLGRYERVLGKLRDRYVLTLSPELRDADRRLVLAFAVALDALQDR